MDEPAWKKQVERMKEIQLSLASDVETVGKKEADRGCFDSYRLMVVVVASSVWTLTTLHIWLMGPLSLQSWWVISTGALPPLIIWKILHGTK